jgi:hypothetical protein
MEWSDIPGYDGVYRVNEKGEILSLTRLINTRGFYTKQKILKPIRSGAALIVNLSVDGKRKRLHVARLVASAFLNMPIDSTMRVRHINNDPFDCNLKNLIVESPSNVIKNKHIAGQMNTLLPQEFLRELIVWAEEKGCNDLVDKIQDYFKLAT